MSTSNEALDQLFSEIRKELKEQGLKKVLTEHGYSMAKHIVSSYNLHNSKTKVTEEELSAFDISLDV